MNDRKPPDQEAREAIRSSLGVTMLVEAAAGTGKTTSLVGRMVNLVRQGNASASTLAAITFTVKAAAQLRQRFQEEIEKALAVEGDGAISRKDVRPAPEETTAESRRLRAALQEIDRGFIGTTHAFCARLLRERPVEAGLDPEFEELDAAASEPLTAEFWNRWYEEQSFAGNPLLGEALEVGLDRKTLRGAFEKIVDYPDVILVAQRSERPDLRTVSDKLVRLVENVEPHLPSDADRDEPDQFEKMVVKLLRQRRSSDLDEPFEQFALLDEGDHAQHKPVQKRWPDGRVAKALWEEYSEFVVNELRPALQRWREHVHGIALEVLRPAAETFAAERRLHGTLTFQDLLVCARDLLRDHPVVRRYFQKRFTHLLVDEFQDTDPLQAEVLFYLTGQDVSERNWRKLRPRPGSLFIVGDPKQSIYRFRRADITTYLDVRNRIEQSDGEIYELSTNFRSGPAVCDFVNDAFVTLFRKEDVESGRQAPHVDLIPFHTNQPAAIFGLETPDVRPYAAAEAERIGQWILRSVSAQPPVPSSGESPRYSTPPLASDASSDSTGDADGFRDDAEEADPSAFVMERWNATTGAQAALDRQMTLFPPTTPSFIRSSSEEKPPASQASDNVHAIDSRTAPQSAASDAGALRYSDILLISWQRPNLTYYARTFERLGIPYEITGSKAFSRFSELESVMPLLRAMIDPDDEVSVVAFLRGPLNGADDDALYRFVQGGGKFSAFRDVPDGTDERIAAGLAIIHTAITDARQHPPAATIARLFDRLGLLPLAAAASERPGTKSGNLLLALNIARASSARGESLAAIVEQFDDLLATNPDIGELDVDPARSDAVQLMNLHQVKGLEAKVVFLIDPTDPYERAVEFHVDRRDSDRAGDHSMSDEARGYFVVTRPWGRGTKVLGAPPGWKNAPHGWKASEQEAVWTGYEERENEFQRAERQRLLYVAATRAKEMLVVGFRRTRKGVSGPWRELAGRLVDPLPMPHVTASSSPAPEPPAVRLFAEARREIALRFEAAAETSYSVLPITKIAHSNHQDLVRAEEGLGKGMSWGRVLHRLFEAMLRQESIDIRLYAENLLKDEERDVAQLSEVMRVVDAVKSSPLWRRAKAADERYVEIPFAIEVPAAELGLGGPAATLLHGTIDLVFREGNEWFVVDYKTDSIANRLDALTDYYAAQVRLYASFWSRLTSAPASGGLFFVDGCVERWVARTA